MKNHNWKPFDEKLCKKIKDPQKRFEFLQPFVIDEHDRMLFVGCLLQRAALLFKDETALLCDDRTISFNELYHRAVLFSKTLLSLGLQPHDRVLLFVPNSIEFYIAYFAILQCGAVVAPLNIFLTTAELEHIVSDAQPTLIITAKEKKELLSKVSVPVVIAQEVLELQIFTNEIPIFKVHALQEDELAVLLYTSGTTGFPKGVMLSSKNIMTNVIQAISSIPLCKSQRLIGVLPLFHSFAQNTCVWTSLFAGCSVIVVPKIDRRSLFKGLERKPTVFLGVPALYGLLAMIKNADLDSVHYFVCGGDALPDKIRTVFELVYRRKLCNGYGLTETSPLISVDLQDVAGPTNNVGKPSVGVDCSIRDDQGREVSHGEIGVLWVRGDNIMLGYYNAPEKTKEVLQDGWLCTGDFAQFDKEGNLLICGRDKDLIIHKGFNIYPQEIENVILSHMSVLYVGVIGVAGELQGEIPVAYVQLLSGANKETTTSALLSLCKKNLAAYKIPRKIIFIDNMPLTSTNKVDKKVLRKQIKKVDGK